MMESQIENCRDQIEIVGTNEDLARLPLNIGIGATHFHYAAPAEKLDVRASLLQFYGENARKSVYDVERPHRE